MISKLNFFFKNVRKFASYDVVAFIWTIARALSFLAIPLGVVFIVFSDFEDWSINFTWYALAAYFLATFCFFAWSRLPVKRKATF